MRDQGIKVISDKSNQVFMRMMTVWVGRRGQKRQEGSPAKTWRAAPTTPSLWQAPA